MGSGGYEATSKPKHKKEASSKCGYKRYIIIFFKKIFSEKKYGKLQSWLAFQELTAQVFENRSPKMSFRDLKKKSGQGKQKKTPDIGVIKNRDICQ